MTGKWIIYIILVHLYISDTDQAAVGGGRDVNQDVDMSFEEADHAACVHAWAEVNKRQDTGCLEPADVKHFEEQCKIPTLRHKIRGLLTRCHQKKPKQFMSIRRKEQNHENGTHSRHKRLVYADPSRTWPYGIVPYVNAVPGVIRAMRAMERHTCIRWVPWSNDHGVTTNQRLGLGHEGYVDFNPGHGGCWADQGNKRNHQYVSCCGGTVCLHEISHVLGAFHEQQNPLGKGRIRLNPQYTSSGHEQNFVPQPMSLLEDGTLYSDGYDMTSVMAYGKAQFGNGEGNPIEYLFYDIYAGDDWFYLLKEISHTHKCDVMNCSSFTMKCENDGYVTLVDDVCACRCPPGLDPETGCTTFFTDTKPEKWPKGQFAIPKTKDGCPDGLKSGTVIHTGAAVDDCQDEDANACSVWSAGNGCLNNANFMNTKCPKTCNTCNLFGNHVSPQYHLSGTTNNDQVEHDFCVKEETSNDDPNIRWMGGEYCFYRKGGQCPKDTDHTSILFTDEPNSNAANSQSGAKVDGEFSTSTTKFDYCCSLLGFQADELILPRTQPFALMQSNDSHFDGCHKVRGMHAYGDGYTVVKNKGGKPKVTLYTSSGDLSSQTEFSVPLKEYNQQKDQWKIPYCYYMPTKKDCGGIIELTSSRSTVDIEGKPGQEQICEWLIKGPPGTRIVLNFDEINVTRDNDEEDPCVDFVEVKYDRIGQTGKKFCSEGVQRSVSSINNTMRVTFETFTDSPGFPGAGNSHFKANIRLINDDDLCYTAALAGRDYAGPMNFTRGMKPCIPWAQAVNCLHHPFQDSEMHASLTDNRCRNPDQTDGFRPWCYTEIEHCLREYCDPCQFENLFDNHPNCEQLAKLGYCSRKDTMANCAKTCQQNVPSFPKAPLAKDVVCGPPSSIADGDMVESLKSSYAGGEVVTYRCKNSAQPTEAKRTCLTTGQWTSLNYVCTDCEPGWSLHDGKCYKIFNTKISFSQSASACSSMGASMATAKTQEENDFMTKLIVNGNWIWLNAKDDQREDHWKWNDGSRVSWTNWSPGQPDNWRDQDCMVLKNDGKWDDDFCEKYHEYVCAKPSFVPSICDDVTDDCVNFYINNPQSCSTQKDFMLSKCRKTCGKCSNPVTCAVETPTSNAQKASTDPNVSGVEQGQFVTYECKPGNKNVSGDAVRGCLVDGKLSRQPLVCQPEDLMTSNATITKKIDPFSLSRDARVETGNHPGLIIPGDGKIIRWEFWSDKVGDAALQVWRNTTGAQDKLEFIGQNTLTTPDSISTIYYVPVGEQINVKKGDYIGFWTEHARAGIGYTNCDAAVEPGNWGNIKSSATSDTAAGYIPSHVYDFKTVKRNPCRKYQIRAVIG